MADRTIRGRHASNATPKRNANRREVPSLEAAETNISNAHPAHSTVNQTEK
jgi:hypothetical protein